ncbi:ORC-CDC6 family AAA ATPase [Janthinobacterium sp. RA13]|uniref:ORC-CDC6 family AAA ATPase n=1 Tax=Janthinobacterium sp. RA13 TaxID=1502762 RepID=UPI00068E4094|nr:hypothetical protein [Janthinobacterium sp. RA13]
MDNPFKKRATEFIDEPAALISLVSHEPLKIFFDDRAGDAIFEKLVTIIGTPGSGKTTIARLIELDTLMTLMRSAGDSEVRDLISTLNDARIIQELQPNILAYRIPVGSNLRDIWELPYSDAIKSSLLRSFLQAKGVLGWLRKLEKEEVPVRSIKIDVKENMQTEANIIFADNIEKFLDFARGVEEQIFRIITALVPPSEDKLATLTNNLRYNAFDVIETISAPLFAGKPPVKLKPLIILDDAHELHQQQFADVNNWLRGRELRVARWLMTRVDAISTEKLRAALSAAQEEEKPGTTKGRDEIIALLQRTGGRTAFKKIANDISRRYIAQMSSFRRKPGTTLETFLDARPTPLTDNQLAELTQSVEKLISDNKFSPQQMGIIESSIPKTVTADQRLMLTRILISRERKRVPQTQLFFDDQNDNEEAEDDLLNVKPSLVTGADIQLMHDYGRPFYYGLDRLSDASDDNIEQFINLAGALINQIETKVIRGRTAQLDARTQHNALTERAVKTMKEWDFPRSHLVKKMIAFIAKKCVNKTLAANAPLDDGANAYGVPQSEMEHLERTYPVLRQVLHYGLAYNAISLRENYQCKRKVWCLIKLGGLPIIEHKLTFSKGGFCEGHLVDLAESIVE